MKVDKKIPKKPTAMQKRAFQEFLVDDGGTQGEKLVKAGYSSKTAETPTKVTESVGFKQLFEQYLPDKDLAAKHKELMNKKEVHVSTNKFGEVNITPTGEIDTQAVKAALDMAYKIKGNYKEDNDQRKVNVTINVERLAEIDRALDDL